MTRIRFSPIDSIETLWNTHGLHDRAPTAADSPALLQHLQAAFCLRPGLMDATDDILSFKPAPDMTGLILRVTQAGAETVTRLYSPHTTEEQVMTIVQQGDRYSAPAKRAMTRSEKYNLARIRYGSNVPLITDQTPIQRMKLSLQLGTTLTA